MSKQWNRVWIIGASSGIGRALAANYAETGAQVLVSARREAELNQIASGSESICSMPLDVGQPNSITEAVADLAETGQLPDLTIFCAAIYQPGGVGALDLEAARLHMDINYLGAVAVISALVPELSKRGSGAIAITSSLTSYCGLPQAALYGPTKAALSSLCESLKPEFDQMGLELFLINPGFVETRLTEKNDFEMPFLVSSEEAARRIYQGLQRSHFEIAFPMRLAWSLRLLKWLPYRIYFYLMRRLLK